MANRLLYFLFALLLTSCGVQEKKETVRDFGPMVFSEQDFSIANGRMYYNDIPFTGLLVKENGSGTVISKAEYEGGWKHGKGLKWHENGNLQSERFFQRGKKEGLHKGWWPEGGRKFEYTFQNGVHHGPAKEWHLDGRLFRQFNYLEGQEEGRQKAWGQNGKVLMNYAVIKGRRYGYVGTKTCQSVWQDNFAEK